MTGLGATGQVKSGPAYPWRSLGIDSGRQKARLYCSRECAFAPRVVAVQQHRSSHISPHLARDRRQPAVCALLWGILRPRQPPASRSNLVQHFAEPIDPNRDCEPGRRRFCVCSRRRLVAGRERLSLPGGALEIIHPDAANSAGGRPPGHHCSSLCPRNRYLPF